MASEENIRLSARMSDAQWTGAAEALALAQRAGKPIRICSDTGPASTNWLIARAMTEVVEVVAADAARFSRPESTMPPPKRGEIAAGGAGMEAAGTAFSLIRRVDVDRKMDKRDDQRRAAELEAAWPHPEGAKAWVGAARDLQTRLGGGAVGLAGIAGGETRARR